MDTTTTTTITTATLYPQQRPHHHSDPQYRTHRKSLASPSYRISRHSRSIPDAAAHAASQHQHLQYQQHQQYHAPQKPSLSDDLSFHQPSHEHTAYPPSLRPQSPDAQSRVSASSSVLTGGPQLRKKPKSLSIKNKSRPTSSSAADSPTVTLPSALPTEDLPPANSSKSLSRADSGGSQQHSPIYKRPPASHSSYGVETTCGPPPSYTTQRTFSQERIKKPDRNTMLWMPQQDKPSVNQAESQEGLSPAANTQKQDGTSSSLDSSPETPDTQSIPTPTEMDSMANITIRGQRTGGSMESDGKGSSSDDRKSEDLFLNIAKVDAARPTVARTERKRSRISIPFLSGNRNAHGVKSSPVQPQSATVPPSAPLMEEPRYYNKRASLGQHIPGALSRANFIDTNRSQRTVEMPPDTDSYEQQFNRRQSNVNPEQVKLSQRPSQGLRSHRLASEANYASQSRVGEHIATESTVSTAAPSTVWDELDDLKSRIRKLELTGKLPSSSAAAMSSVERPRTATTAATTMSASPKPRPGGPSLPSAIEGIPSNVQPLLHEALGTAKHVLHQDIYHKLHATASDALQLATMMRGEDTSGTSNGMSTNLERQVRRRTENMCRGLTELTIALMTETKGTPVVNRPMSRDQQSHPPSAMLRSRRYSNEPGDRSVTSRTTSRLDNRRASLVLGPMSPDPAASDTSTPLPPLPGLRLARTSTGSRVRRGPGYFDGADDEAEASPSVRPMSRAMTELGAYRRASKDAVEIPRELSKDSPYLSRADSSLPTTTPLPNHISTNFVSRRKYASPASVVGGSFESRPITPREAWGHISVVPQDHVTPSEVASEVDRAGSGRRSLGLAGRLGASMGSRLRAVRADRAGRDSYAEGRGTKEVTSLQRDNEATKGYDRDRAFMDRM